MIKPVGVGVIAPYDFALDAELWRWAPGSVTLHLTRTRYVPLPVTVEQAEVIGEVATVLQSTADLLTPGPAVLAYACTSGSFVGGRAGERALVGAMTSAGAPDAVTTSGALLEALSHLGVSRLAVATPYDAHVTARLVAFLGEAGVQVVSSSYLGLTERVWAVPYDTTTELARRAVTGDAEAVFISCTNLPTYDIIPTLEAELGVPLLTANQVTMWAALRRAGQAAVGPGQRLLTPADPAPLSLPSAS